VRRLRAPVLLALAVSAGAAAAEPAVPDPDPWLGTSGVSLVGVSDDGAVVVFRKQHEGIPQIFRTDAQGRAPTRVTLRAEPVDFAVLSPDGTKVVVGYDAGGDEDTGLHVVDVADGRERPLSVAPDVQHGSVVWSRLGDRVFFRSNRASRKDFHLHEARLADASVRTVLAREGSWNVHDVDREGRRLLVGHYRSNRDASLHLLDLRSGQTTEIDPPPAGKTFAAGEASFVAGRDEAVFLSDRDGRRRLAYVVGLSDLRVRPLVSERSEHDVDEAVPALEGNSVLLVENVDGYGRPSQVDGATGRRIPWGPDERAVVGGPRWDRRGNAYWTRAVATEPSSVVRLAASSRDAPTVLATPEMGSIPRSALPEPPRLVSYPTFDGRSIPAWLHRPRGTGSKRLPFLVHVHGGPEGQERPTFSPDRAYLLSLGYGVLAPNVRGSTGYGREYLDLDDYRKRLDAVKDVKAAAEWLVREGHADPGGIAVIGGSYGGYVVLACLTEFPETFAAGVDVVGIANFETFLERTAPYRRALREAEYGPLSDREFLRSISPIHKVDRIRAPLLIAHGENDPRVPVHEARQIEAALKAKGSTVESVYFPDEGHGWQKRENRRKYLMAAAAFLRRSLGR
jgi:dipeptidyl aminopeptidase/acylaminoacyl peptidase